jgi:hypothetical protein
MGGRMNKNDFIIELDGLTYRLSSKTLQREADFQSAGGCKFLVSDFGKSISRVMHVAADIRYAEAVVAKMLQNEGEFDEPVTVITHWKKKQGNKSTDIFFTALSSRSYFQYLDKIIQHEDFLMLIPVFRVLSVFINQLNPKDTIAVIFRHSRFADLVIGKNNQFYLATQCMAFDNSDEQAAVLWETVLREISTHTRATSVPVKKVIVLNWIDIKEDIPTTETLGMEPFVFDPEPIAFENTLHLVSFTRALSQFPPMEGISPKNEKLFFYCDKFVPYVMGFFVIAIVVSLFGTYFYSSKTRPLTENVTALEQRLNQINSMALSQPRESDYLDTLKFVDTLFHSRNLPSCKDIINDISMGVSSSMLVEELKIDYPGRSLKIRLTGRIGTDFDKAYKDYQALVSSLLKDGYTVDGNTFNTRIDSSRFELFLSRGIQ